MRTRLADRLASARRSRFVGRSGELNSFQEAFQAAEPPYQVLFVFGPGGVGKTLLLRELAHTVEQHDGRVIYLDARNLEPSPVSFLQALRGALNLTPDQDPLAALAAQAQRTVLMLDTFEGLCPLEDWLRDDFLPELPENALVIFAGREPPGAGWQADPGWQTLLRVISLRNLSPDESREYLRRRNIPDAQHRAILDFTHGHPLALSLIADAFDQRGELAFPKDDLFKPEAAPDIVKILLEQFVQKVPGPAHRAALEACAMVRVTTESILAAMLALPDPTLAMNAQEPGAQSVHELFEWLRSLSFIEARTGGLFPHDLAREALIADVRWRNPDWYAELHRRARNYYTARVRLVPLQEQQRVIYDLLFLHRDNAIIRAMFDWQATGGIITDAMHDEDLPTLLQMVETHEGAESASLARTWFARQPDKVTVYRDAAGEPIGLFMLLALQEATPAQIAADPATRLAWDYLSVHAPLRAGEVASHYRFWMARDTYQNVSPVQTQIFLTTIRHQLLTPGLAYHFFPCADADFWCPILTYGDLTRTPELDYSIGEKRYGVFVHDWRVTPPLAWLALLAEREVAAQAGAPAPRPQAQHTLVVLSREDFDNAIHAALRDFSRPHRLRENPLLRSRMVVERAGAQATTEERMTALQALLRQVVETPQVSPREAKLYRAVEYTYLKPAMTQEQAAEALDVPFSTYRRHLKAGLIRVVDALWQKEIGNSH